MICDELNRLADEAVQDNLVLYCTCQSSPCIGDVIKSILETAIKEAVGD